LLYDIFLIEFHTQALHGKTVPTLWGGRKTTGCGPILEDSGGCFGREKYAENDKIRHEPNMIYRLGKKKNISRKRRSAFQVLETGSGIKELKE